MTDTVDPADTMQAASPDSAKKAKHHTRRRLAKLLLYISLAVSALMVLAEPWLLVPLLTAAVAVALWD